MNELRKQINDLIRPRKKALSHHTPSHIIMFNNKGDDIMQYVLVLEEQIDEVELFLFENNIDNFIVYELGRVVRKVTKD